MISVLTQERLLGFALGSVFTAAVVLENRKSIHRMVSETNCMFGNQPQKKIPTVREKSPLDVGHFWNKGVEKTLGSAIESLSSRGW